MRLGRRPALDGLRGLAVLAVLLNHFGLRYGSGGMVGVDVFFALSGFLITKLLLEESQDGPIDFRAFYRRRAARLLPALAVLLVVTVGVALATGVARHQVLTSAGPVALYVGNWWRVAGHDMGPLGHTWSLAVEEQFYLVWPLIIFAVRGRRGLVAAAASVGVVAALAVRVGTCADGSCVIRVYHSTDTRMDQLLLGALLAVAFHSGWIRPIRRVWLAEVLGWASLLGLAAIAVSPLRWDSRFYDMPGMTVTAALACMVITATLLADTALLARVLGWTPLAKVGLVSYGIYLWMGVTGVFLHDGTSLGPHTRAVLVTVIAGAAAALSWLLVERPVLRRAKAARGLRAAADEHG